MSKQLVNLRTRSSRDGQSFTYYLDYLDEFNKRHRISLGHSNRRKAERQRTHKEQELRMGIIEPESMKLSKFLENSLLRTGSQIRESTQVEYRASMNDFINAVGNIDYQNVTHRHGEVFLQNCLDEGNSPATTAKKLRQIRRFFQLAVQRGQLDDNPLKYVKSPKVPKKKVRVYTTDECSNILESSRKIQKKSVLQWDLLITIALVTAMRKSELLNTVWSDIDFEKKTIEVSPKRDTEETWEWHVKDTDCRILPLTDLAIRLLIQLQAERPVGYPYVFLPPQRYDHIQKLRKRGSWTLSSARIKVINNFTRQFKRILTLAGIDKGEFHDLRRTGLSRMLARGLSKYDLMTIAGHAKFETTQQFYLAVEDNLVGRARDAVTEGFGDILARTWHAGDF
ncbi:Tyrosine recombinase XerD [Limihaloglobus sulfuriphilus]|uniref:Tyrosine recombinase XerD n=1 Tax=Limihaloglobus sulfuriphilus TaxID=1851148 RepID=A0A1Q2MDY4_9BACT|nr:tyrosine-type recombinase/integrase [Limihaloglobus sulfuriphilus]AQQ70911.1 Tyrosine recombinase XerD [Limihaloglobus sulfuriphilus]